jgi:cytidylate kinase
MDTNAHAERIREIEQILQQEEADQIYRVLKICLNPPYETLLARIRAREQIPGVHQGTETDLLESYFSTSAKKINPNDYDIVIDSSEMTLEEEWLLLADFFNL